MNALHPDVEIIRDVVYTSVAGQDLLVDVYRPTEREPLGAIVYFHGGGWEFGDRTDYEDTRQSVLASRGFVVASVQYRFLPGSIFPAQLDDARAAVSWLRVHAADYGVTGDRIGAWGSSAGGHLATLLALGNPEAGEKPDVEAAVSWFGPSDLAMMNGGTALEQEFIGNAIDGFVGGTFDLTRAEHRAADPLSLANGDAAPILLVTGDRDRMIDAGQSERLFRALSRAGAQVSLHLVAGVGHEDANLEGPHTLGAVAGFLEQHIGGQS